MVIPSVLWFSHRLPVSVCGTGTLCLPSSFSRQCEFIYFATNFTPHHHLGFSISVLYYLSPSWFGHASPSAWLYYPSASLLQLFINIQWYWNLYQLCIAYAVRPVLSSRLTLGGWAFPRKPQTFDGVVSRHTLATHAGILSSIQSTAPFSTASARIQCSSTNALTYIPKFRCVVLAPLHFRRIFTRLVSYYALFEWVAASKPTS